MRLRQKKDKPPLAAVRTFHVEDTDELLEWKRRYSGPKYTHRTAVRIVKFDSVGISVIVGVARRKGAIDG